MKEIRMKQCANTGCKKDFIPFRTTDKVCSFECARILQDKKNEEKAKRWNEAGKPKPRKVKIRPMSEKLAADYKVYRPIRDKYMKEHPKCECGCGRRSNDLHHKMGRSGYADAWAEERGIKLLWDVRFFMAVARFCHNLISDNTTEARELGYLLT